MVPRTMEGEASVLTSPIEREEMETAIHYMKNGKAAGLDDIYVEQIIFWGDLAKQWLLSLFSVRVTSNCIPKIWRKAQIIAFLKPEKKPNEPRNFIQFPSFVILSNSMRGFH